MPYSNTKCFRYRYDYEEKPLYTFIRERYGSRLSGKKIQELFEKRITLNGKNTDPDRLIQKGDWIEYLHLREDEKPFLDELEVLYEDEWILAVSKPGTLPVVPSGEYYFTSLAILLRERLGNDWISPLHRLDLETSGVLLFGKTQKARRLFQPLFAKGKGMIKRYEAITFGVPPIKEISGDILPAEGSKIFSKMRLQPSADPKSTTHILHSEAWGDFGRVHLQPITGKTNQIRIHLASIGHEIVGDKKYYPDESIFLEWFEHRDVQRVLPTLKLHRQALHCHSLEFIHPISKERIYIEDTTKTWSKLIHSLL